MYTGDHRIFVINGAGEIVTIRLGYLKGIRIADGNHVFCEYEKHVDNVRIIFHTDRDAEEAMCLIAEKLEAIDIEVSNEKY